MPKSRKQRTKVKKQTNQSTKKSNEPIPAVPLLESSTEEDFADVSEERASILTIVKDLEGQVDTAYQLKEILEAELDATKKKLSEESTARAQFEAQVESLGAQAALVDQLHEDISFAEEERDKSANLLVEIQQQLEAVTKERDSLAEEVDSAKSLNKKFEGEKVALEAQVMNLKDKIADMDNLRSELDETIKTRKNLDKQIRALSNRLKGAENSKKAFEKDLTAAQKQLESLQGKLMVADSRVVEMRARLEEQQATNRELMEANTRLENELKSSKVSFDAANNELEAFKAAMHDIHSEASRTSGRVRQRYFKLKDKK
jgi:chromosome segregation ATPase